MGNSSRINNNIISRNKKLEKSLGIDDIKIYAYMQYETQLRIVCEIVSNGIVEPYSFQCTVYDTDGDVIATEENCSYGGGHCISFVTSMINQKSFYNGIPFEFELHIPKGSKPKKIKIVPKK